MIVPVTGGYMVKSETGKSLGGPYKTRKEAEDRLKEVEMFKHMSANIGLPSSSKK